MDKGCPQVRDARNATDVAVRVFCARVLDGLHNPYTDVATAAHLSGFRLWSAYAAAAEDSAAEHVRAGNLPLASRALKAGALYRLVSAQLSAPLHACAEARGAAAKDLAAALRFESTQLAIYEISAGPWNVTGYLRSACTTMRAPLVIMLPSPEASAELLYLLFADVFYHAGTACMWVDVAARTGLQPTATPGHYLRGGLVRQLLDVATDTTDLGINGATLVDLSNTDEAAMCGISQDPRVRQWVSGSGVFPWSKSAPTDTVADLGVPQLHIYGGGTKHDLLWRMSNHPSAWSRPSGTDWSELARRISGWALTSRADAVLATAGC
jgi:hypothetical protein